MVKKVLKISGMHCSSCALNVEWALEDLGAKAKCDYARQEVAVEYPENVDEQALREAIKKEGYQVED